MAAQLRSISGGPRQPGRDGDRELRFSFRYLDLRNPLFSVDTRDKRYYQRLLDRLKELSAFNVGEFTSNRSPALRVHRIRFGGGTLAQNGFGVPGRPEADEMGWQFSVSANEHGRVHGFLSGDTFYVRWLDPDHQLYSGN
jgi:hypothetical protein